MSLREKGMMLKQCIVYYSIHYSKKKLGCVCIHTQKMGDTVGFGRGTWRLGDFLLCALSSCEF